MSTGRILGLAIGMWAFAGCGGEGISGEPDASALYAQVCCDPASSQPCEQPDHGLCAEGLTCYVVPGGPYAATGVCTQACDTTTPCPTDPPGGTCDGGFCTFPCNSSLCTGVCDPGELCPPGLTCRSMDCMH